MSISPTTKLISASDLLFAGAVLLFVALPLFRGMAWPVEELVLHGCLLVMVFGFECREVSKGRTIFFFLNRERPLNWILPLLILWGYIQCFWVSLQPNTSLLEHTSWMSTFFAFCITARLAQRRSRREQLLWILGTITSLFALHSLWLHTLPQAPVWWEKPEFVSGTYVNHNHFAGWMELGLGTLAGLFMAHRGAARSLAFTGLMLCLAALVVSNSRGAWISMYLASGAGVLILLRDPWLRQRALLSLLLWVLLPLGLAFFAAKDQNVASRLQSFVSSEGMYEFRDFRLKLYESTLQASLHQPWMGQGPGAFGFAMLPHRQKGFEFRFDYAHQDYLQIAMEYGYPTLILLLLWIGTRMVQAILRFHSRKLQSLRFEEWGVWLGILSLLIHSLVDFNLSLPGNRVLFAMVLGLVAFPTPPRPSRSQVQ